MEATDSARSSNQHGALPPLAYRLALRAAEGGLLLVTCGLACLPQALHALIAVLQGFACHRGFE